MDYLLDRYVFAFLPFKVSDEWKQKSYQMGMSTVRVADWVCKTQDLQKFYANHANFLFAELLYPILALITFIHAYRHGGRYIYTWLGILLFQITFGLSISLGSAYALDNYWNAQGLLTFFGARFPLSILFGIYQVLLYASFIFVQRMYLPFWAEAAAAGFAFLLLKLPWMFVGTRFLWLTWQTGEQQLIYGVPWAAFFLDTSIACTFVWLLRGFRWILLDEMYDWKRFVREFACAFLAGMLAFWIPLAQFAGASYLAKLYSVPFGVVAFMFISFHAALAFIGDRRNQNPKAHKGNAYWFDELSLAVCLHFLFLIILVSVTNPANIVSEGLHQPLGPCNKAGTNLLCPHHINNTFYDFHCYPSAKLENYEDGLEWYAICGTPFKNRPEYIFLLISHCVLALFLLYQAAAASGETPHIYRVVYGRSKEKKKTK